MSYMLLGIRDIECFPDDISSSDFKSATITSVDVDCSFSMYKSVLNNSTKSFKFENIYKQIITSNFPGINYNIFLIIG